MERHTLQTIHPDILDQDEYLTHLASVDAHADILLDRALHSALNAGEKQDIAKLIELMLTVGEVAERYTIDIHKLALPA